MNELKIGDRIEVIYVDTNDEVSLKVGMRGTVKSIEKYMIGIEFDDFIGGHYGTWNGQNGHCWYVDSEFLRKIEETKEKTKEKSKVDTLEQKILMALREEIGVDIGEEFSVCKIGGEQWACKFEENGFTHKMNGNFCESGFWKSIISDFQSFKFKKKPLFPRKEEPYFYVQMRLDDNGNAIYDGVDYVYWYGKDFDIAMLITGNYFKTEEEAEDNKEKVIERMNELLKSK